MGFYGKYLTYLCRHDIGWLGRAIHVPERLRWYYVPQAGHHQMDGSDSASAQLKPTRLAD